MSSQQSDQPGAAALRPRPQLNVALDLLEDKYGLNPPDDALYEAFTQWADGTGRPLYPHQEEALLAAIDDAHMIVSTPTGSGKSLIALTAIFCGLARGKTAYYTAPLKALVSEKFFELINVFGADNVGMVTGDSTINPGAPVVCATAEIVANLSLREGAAADIGVLVQDEFHYYSDPQRGWAWQVPLLELTRTQQVLLSATLGDTTWLAEDLEKRTGRAVELMSNAERPVPLSFSYSYQPLGELLLELTSTHRAPVYVVHFSQREAVAQAQTLLTHALVSKEQKNRIHEALGDFSFGPGFGKILSKLLRSGIGVHHAGLLPRYRRLVEKLAQAGLLPVISGTDTLGVGINVPIRTVVMTGLAKFDGQRNRHLSAREFHQIAGRAGRAGFDTKGDVIVQAPEFEIENARLVARAGDDPVKQRRIQKKKPPENTVLWSEKTFEYLKGAAPETLTSHMRVSHSLMLNLFQRPGDNVAAVTKLLTDNHEPRTASNQLIRQATRIYMSLERAGVILHRTPQWLAEHPDHSPIEYAREVPDDFSLNQPLAPFALAALDILDPDSPEYALDVISVIEAVQDNPMQVLYAQERAARGRAIGRMKAAGIGYDERMAEADKITWPQPLAEELGAALQIYRQTNPWVDDFQLSPKSIVREMIENAITFSEFISRYDLARSEGTLLRYLTDTYKALRQTVPLEARTQDLEDMTAWLGSLVRSVDSSLLDEWEALRDGRITTADITNLDSSTGGARERAFGADEDGKVTLSRSPHALRVSIRNALFRFVEAVAHENLDWLDRAALDDGAGVARGEGIPLWVGGPVWDGDAWMDATDAYFDSYQEIGTGAEARSAQLVTVLEHPDRADFITAGVPAAHVDSVMDNLTTATGRLRAWLVRQVFDDGAGDNSWGFWAVVDLEASDEAGHAILDIISVGEL